MDTGQTRPFKATAAASEALARLRAAHGDIILHVTSGCCDARTPLCLKANELSLGARDVLLGNVEGVPVYEMPSTSDSCCTVGGRILDVVRGVPVGFSIAPGDGLRFALRDVAASQAEQTSAQKVDEPVF